MNPSTFVFAPHLTAKIVKQAVDFYVLAFEARVVRKWENDDGSLHVAELKIGDSIFHIHEEVISSRQVSPETANATTVLIGLFCDDPDRLFSQAVQYGGKVLNAMQDYDYGYRQGTVIDPCGHQWLLQKKI